jgi:hypothetical protein
MEFWSALLEDHPDLSKLNSTGSKINSTIVSVEEHWNKLQKINPNAPKVLKLSSSFNLI